MNIGNYIDQVLQAKGGSPPYQWDADLPEGLKVRQWGAVFGVMPNPDEAEHAAKLTVQDHTHNRAEKRVNIAAQPMSVPPDGFYAVPGGDLLIGYHPSKPRNGWLNRLCSQGYPINVEAVSETWPAGRIHVDGFYMQKYEVTNAQYLEFIKASGRMPLVHWSDGTPPERLLDHPVVNVSYDDAVAFCKWKTELSAQASQPYVYRLPVNWQWEKAAKGPTVLGQDPASADEAARLYPWGDMWGTGNLHDLNSGVLETLSVTRHAGAPSSFPVYDLGGNVSEWIDGGTIEGGQVLMDVRGASFRTRGQLFALTFARLRLVDRRRKDDDIGFRCAVHLKPERRPTQVLIPLGGEAGGYIDAAGNRQHISRFYMARFAVSNDEFSQFSPGHTFEEAERWHPVTNVSYQEAVDFCKWKTQLEGRFYRLPSRQEWERAYRGTEGRNYPWGEEYSRYYCNSLESGWGRPVDVWALWQGATPEGIYNLCGNTFEWLFEAEAVGGSWCSTCASYDRAPFDDGAVDRAGRPDIGFRYVTH